MRPRTATRARRSDAALGARAPHTAYYLPALPIFLAQQLGDPYLDMIAPSRSLFLYAPSSPASAPLTLPLTMTGPAWPGIRGRWQLLAERAL